MIDIWFRTDLKKGWMGVKNFLFEKHAMEMPLSSRTSEILGGGVIKHSL